MVSSFKYRPVAIILAGVFAVFSIGIPVVLASCPMMKASVSVTCCSKNPTSGSPIIKSQRDYSCYKTVIAAQRNTNEYVQTQVYASNIEKHIFITPIFQYSIDIDFRIALNLTRNNIYSLPLSEDIPIFTSSLLI